MRVAFVFIKLLSYTFLNAPYLIYIMYQHIAKQKTIKDFAENILDISEVKLTEIEESKASSSTYKQIKIKKKKKKEGYRIAYKIDNNEEILKLYKKLNLKLFWYLNNKDPYNPSFPHESSYGYIKGRNILENAKVHCGKKMLMKIDIKDFFNSITTEKISKELEEVGVICKEVADAMAKFVCINNTLPLGLHTSPLISNVVCFDMDKKIYQKCKEHELEYTRYADDITISSNSSNDSDISNFKEDIYKIIEGSGFTPNDEKFRITKNGMAHFVTGLSVSDKVPHVPKRIKRTIRQKLYFIRKFGFEGHCTRKKIENSPKYEFNKIDGYIGFMQSIEKDNKSSEEMFKIWKEEKVSQSLNRFRRKSLAIEESSFYIDESCFSVKNKEEVNEKHFFALCAVKVDDNYIKTYNELLEESKIKKIKEGLTTKKESDSLCEKGFHFADMNEDLRRFLVDKVKYMQFKTFIAFLEIKEKDKYTNDDYIKLLKKCLEIPLKKAKLKPQVILEENNKLIKDKIEKSLKGLHDNISVEIQKKNATALMCLPDVMLGIFGKYFKEVGSNNNRYDNFYTSLLNKYNIIIDCSNNGVRVYGRKNIFKLKNMLELKNQKTS